MRSRSFSALSLLYILSVYQLCFTYADEASDSIYNPEANFLLYYTTDVVLDGSSYSATVEIVAKSQNVLSNGAVIKLDKRDTHLDLDKFDFSGSTLQPQSSDFRWAHQSGDGCTLFAASSNSFTLSCAAITSTKPLRFVLTGVTIPIAYIKSKPSGYSQTIQDQSATGKLPDQVLRSVFDAYPLVAITATLPQPYSTKGTVDMTVNTLTLTIRFPYSPASGTAFLMVVQVPEGVNLVYRNLGSLVPIRALSGNTVYSCLSTVLVAESDYTIPFSCTLYAPVGGIAATVAEQTACRTEGCTMAFETVLQANIFRETFDLSGMVAFDCNFESTPVKMGFSCNSHGVYVVQQPTLPITFVDAFVKVNVPDLDLFLPDIPATFTVRMRYPSIPLPDTNTCLYIKVNDNYLRGEFKSAIITLRNSTTNFSATETLYDMKDNNLNEACVPLGAAVNVPARVNQIVDFQISEFRLTNPVIDNIYEKDAISKIEVAIKFYKIEVVGGVNKVVLGRTVATPLREVNTPSITLLAPFMVNVKEFKDAHRFFIGQPNTLTTSFKFTDVITADMDGRDSPHLLVRKDTATVFFFDPTENIMPGTLNYGFNITLRVTGVNGVLVSYPILIKPDDTTSPLTKVSFLWPTDTSLLLSNVEIEFAFTKVPTHITPIFFDMYVGMVSRVTGNLPMPEENDFTGLVTQSVKDHVLQYGGSFTVNLSLVDYVPYTVARLEGKLQLKFRIDTGSELYMSGATTVTLSATGLITDVPVVTTRTIVMTLSQQGLLALGNNAFAFTVANYRSSHDNRPIPASVVIYATPSSTGSQWHTFPLLRTTPFSIPAPLPLSGDASLIDSTDVTCGDFSCDLEIRIKKESLCPLVLEGVSTKDNALDIIFTMPAALRRVCRYSSWAKCAKFAYLKKIDNVHVELNMEFRNENRELVMIPRAKVNPCTADFGSTAFPQHLVFYIKEIVRPNVGPALTEPFQFEMRRGTNSRVIITGATMNIPAVTKKTISTAIITVVPSITTTTFSYTDVARTTFKIFPAIPVHPFFVYRFTLIPESGCYVLPSCNNTMATSASMGFTSTLTYNYQVYDSQQQVSYQFDTNPTFTDASAAFNLPLQCVYCGLIETTLKPAFKFDIFNSLTSSVEYELFLSGSYLTQFTNVVEATRVYDRAVRCTEYTSNDLSVVSRTNPAVIANSPINLRCQFVTPYAMYIGQFLDVNVLNGWVGLPATYVKVYTRAGEVVAEGSGVSLRTLVSKLVYAETSLIVDMEGVRSPIFNDISAGTSFALFNSQNGVTQSVAVWKLNPARLEKPLILDPSLSNQSTMNLIPTTGSILYSGLSADMVFTFQNDFEWPINSRIVVDIPGYYFFDPNGLYNIDGNVGFVTSTCAEFPSTTIDPVYSGTGSNRIVSLTFTTTAVLAPKQCLITVSKVMIPSLYRFDMIETRFPLTVNATGNVLLSKAFVIPIFNVVVPPTVHHSFNKYYSTGAVVSATTYNKNALAPLGVSNMGRDVNAMLPFTNIYPSFTFTPAMFIFSTIPRGITLFENPAANIQYYDEATDAFVAVGAVTCTLENIQTADSMIMKSYTDELGITIARYRDSVGASAGMVFCTTPSDVVLTREKYFLVFVSGFVKRTFASGLYCLHHAGIITGTHRAFQYVNVPLISYSAPIPYPTSYISLVTGVSLALLQQSAYGLKLLMSYQTPRFWVLNTNLTTNALLITTFQLSSLDRNNYVAGRLPSITGATNLITTTTFTTLKGQFADAAITSDGMHMYVASGSSIYTIYVANNLLTLSTTVAKVPKTYLAGPTATSKESTLKFIHAVDSGLSAYVLAVSQKTVYLFQRKFTNGRLTYKTSYSFDSDIVQFTGLPISPSFAIALQDFSVVFMRVIVSYETSGPTYDLTFAFQNLASIQLPGLVSSMKFRHVSTASYALTAHAVINGGDTYTIFYRAGEGMKANMAIMPEARSKHLIRHVLSPPLGREAVFVTSNGEILAASFSEADQTLYRNNTEHSKFRVASGTTGFPAMFLALEPQILPDGSGFLYISTVGGIIYVSMPPIPHEVNLKYAADAVVASPNSNFLVEFQPSTYPFVEENGSTFSLVVGLPTGSVPQNTATPPVVYNAGFVSAGGLETLLTVTASIDNSASPLYLRAMKFVFAVTGGVTNLPLYTTFTNDNPIPPIITLRLALQMSSIPSLPITKDYLSRYPHRGNVAYIDGNCIVPGAGATLVSLVYSTLGYATLAGLGRSNNLQFVEYFGYNGGYARTPSNVTVSFRLPKTNDFTIVPTASTTDKLILKLSPFIIQPATGNPQLPISLSIGTNTVPSFCTYNDITQDISCEVNPTGLTITNDMLITFTVSLTIGFQTTQAQNIEIALLLSNLSNFCAACKENKTLKPLFYHPSHVVGYYPTNLQGLNFRSRYMFVTRPLAGNNTNNICFMSEEALLQCYYITNARAMNGMFTSFSDINWGRETAPTQLTTGFPATTKFKSIAQSLVHNTYYFAKDQFILTYSMPYSSTTGSYDYKTTLYTSNNRYAAQRYGYVEQVPGVSTPLSQSTYLELSRNNTDEKYGTMDEYVQSQYLPSHTGLLHTYLYAYMNGTNFIAIPISPYNGYLLDNNAGYTRRVKVAPAVSASRSNALQIFAIRDYHILTPSPIVHFYLFFKDGSYGVVTDDGPQKLSLSTYTMTSQFFNTLIPCKDVTGVVIGTYPHAYVSCFTGLVTRIDLSTNTVVNSYNLNIAITSMDIHPSKQIIVVGTNNGMVIPLDIDPTTFNLDYGYLRPWEPVYDRFERRSRPDMRRMDYMSYYRSNVLTSINNLIFLPHGSQLVASGTPATINGEETQLLYIVHKLLDCSLHPEKAIVSEATDWILTCTLPPLVLAFSNLNMTVKFPIGTSCDTINPGISSNINSMIISGSTYSATTFTLSFLIGESSMILSPGVFIARIMGMRNSPTSYSTLSNLYVGLYEIAQTRSLEIARSENVVSKEITFDMVLTLVQATTSPTNYIAATQVNSVRIAFSPPPTQPTQLVITLSLAAQPVCKLSTSDILTTFLDHTITVTVLTATAYTDIRILCNGLFARTNPNAVIMTATQVTGDYFPAKSSALIFVHPYMSFKFDSFKPVDTPALAESIPAGRPHQIIVEFSHTPIEVFDITVTEDIDPSCYFVLSSDNSVIVHEHITIPATSAYIVSLYSYFCVPSSTTTSIQFHNKDFVNPFSLSKRDSKGSFEFLHLPRFDIPIDDPQLVKLQFYPKLDQQDLGMTELQLNFTVMRENIYVPDVACGFITEDLPEFVSSTDMSLFNKNLSFWETTHQIAVTDDISELELVILCDNSVFKEQQIFLQLSSNFAFAAKNYKLFPADNFVSYFVLNHKLFRFDGQEVVSSNIDVGARVIHFLEFSLHRALFIDTVVSISSSIGGKCVFSLSITSPLDFTKENMWSNVLNINIPKNAVLTVPVYFFCKEVNLPTETATYAKNDFVVKFVTGDNVRTYTMEDVHVHGGIVMFAPDKLNKTLPLLLDVSRGTTPDIVDTFTQVAFYIYPAPTINDVLGFGVATLTPELGGEPHSVTGPGITTGSNHNYGLPGSALYWYNFKYGHKVMPAEHIFSATLTSANTFTYSPFLSNPIYVQGIIEIMYEGKLFNEKEGMSALVIGSSSESITITVFGQSIGGVFPFADITALDDTCTINDSTTNNYQVSMTPNPGRPYKFTTTLALTCSVTTRGTQLQVKMLRSLGDPVSTNQYPTVKSAIFTFKSKLSLLMNGDAVYPAKLSTQIAYLMTISFNKTPSRPQTLSVKRNGDAGKCGFLLPGAFVPNAADVYDPYNLPDYKDLRVSIDIVQSTPADTLYLVMWCIEPHIRGTSVSITSATDSTYNTYTPIVPVYGNYLSYSNPGIDTNMADCDVTIPYHDFFGSVDIDNRDPALPPVVAVHSSSITALPAPHVLSAIKVWRQFCFITTPSAPFALNVHLYFNLPANVRCYFNAINQTDLVLNFQIGQYYSHFNVTCEDATIGNVYIVGKSTSEHPFSNYLSRPMLVKGSGVFGVDPVTYAFSPALTSYIQYLFHVTVSPIPPVDIVFSFTIPAEHDTALCKFYLPTIDALINVDSDIVTVTLPMGVSKIDLSIVCRGFLFPASTEITFTDLAGYYLPFKSPLFQIYSSVWVEELGQELAMAPVPPLTIPYVVVNTVKALSVRINSVLAVSETFRVEAVQNNIAIEICQFSLTNDPSSSTLFALPLTFAPGDKVKDFFMFCPRQVILRNNMRLRISPTDTSGASRFGHYTTAAFSALHTFSFVEPFERQHIDNNHIITVHFSKPVDLTTQLRVTVIEPNDGDCSINIVGEGYLKSAIVTISPTASVPVTRQNIEVKCLKVAQSGLGSVLPKLSIANVYVNENPTNITDPNFLHTNFLLWPVVSPTWETYIATCPVLTTSGATISYVLGTYANEAPESQRNRTYLSVATFNCQVGYKIAINGVISADLATKKSITCLKEEVWNPNEVITCQPFDCGFFQNHDINANAIFVPVDRTYGSIYTTQCHDGFNLVHKPTFINPNTNALMEPGTSFCTGDGWSDLLNPPRCVIKTCPLVDLISDATIRYLIYSNGNTDNIDPFIIPPVYNDTYQILCGSGFSAEGATNYVCNSNGAWQRVDALSSDFVKCNAQFCHNLLTPTNGNPVSYRYGTETIMNPPNSDGSFSIDTVSKYACQSGYYLADSNKNYVSDIELAVRTCTVSGWSNTAFRCMPQSCPSIPVVPRSTLSYTGRNGEFHFQSISQVSCELGYRVIGNTVSVKKVCNAGSTFNGLTGMWNDTTTYGCNPVQCYTSTINIVNAQLLTITDDPSVPVTIDYSNSVKYQCSPAFNLVGGYMGTNTRFCGDGGWEPVANPECVSNDCGPLLVTSVNVAVAYTSTTFGAVATYTCKSEGFVMVDGLGAPHNGTRTCGTLAESWRGVEPTCIPNECSAIVTLPAHTDVVVYTPGVYGNTKYGAKAKQQCLPGYKNSVTTQLSCSVTGWTGSYGICEDIDECSLTGVDAPCKEYNGRAVCKNIDGGYLCLPFVIADSLKYIGDDNSAITNVVITPARAIEMPDVLAGHIITFLASAGFNTFSNNLAAPVDKPAGYAITEVVDPLSPIFDMSFKNFDGYLDGNLMTYGCARLVIEYHSKISSLMSSVPVGTPADTNVYKITCTVPSGTGRNQFLRLHYCAPLVRNGHIVCTYVNLDRTPGAVRNQKDIQNVNYAYHLNYPVISFTRGTIHSYSFSTEQSRAYSLMTGAEELIAIGLTNLYVEKPSLISITYGPANNVTQYNPAFEALFSKVYSSPARFVIFKSLPYLTGVNMLVRVTLANNTVTSQDTLSYPSIPVITQIRGCDVNAAGMAINCNTAGGQLLMIDGFYLMAPIRIYINGRECPIQNVGEGGLIVTCTLPSGVGLNHNMVVQSALVKITKEKAVSYSPPIIHSVEGCAHTGNATYVYGCNRQGGDIITVVGSNFGTAGFSVTIDFLPCSNLQAYSDFSGDYFTCNTPPGTNKEAVIYISQKYGLGSAKADGFVGFEQCAMGTYHDGLDCIDCPEGTYAGQSGSRECLACPAGRFSNATATAECTACLAGTSSLLQSTSCFNCGVGTFSNVGGPACLVCAKNTYAPLPATKDCLPCSANAQQTIDYTFCECKAGFYLDANGVCARCISGGNCLSAGTTLFNMNSSPGFYSALAVDEEPARRLTQRYLALNNDLRTLLDIDYDPANATASVTRAVMDYFVSNTVIGNSTATQAALIGVVNTFTQLDIDLLTSNLHSSLFHYNAWLPRYRISIIPPTIERVTMTVYDLALILTGQVHLDTVVGKPVTKGSVAPTQNAVHNPLPGAGLAFNGAWRNLDISVPLARLDMDVYPGGKGELSVMQLSQKIITTFNLYNTTRVLSSERTDESSKFAVQQISVLAEVPNNILYSDSSYNNRYYYHTPSGIVLLDDYAAQPSMGYAQCSGSACLGADTCQFGYEGVLCATCSPEHAKHSAFKCVKCPGPFVKYFYYALSIFITVSVCAFLSWKQIADSQVIVDELPAPAFPMLVKVIFSGVQTIAFASRFDAEWPDALSDLLDIAHVIGNVGTYITTLDCFIAEETSSLASIWVNSLAILVLPFAAIILPLIVWIPRYYVVKGKLMREEKNLAAMEKIVMKNIYRKYLEYVSKTNAATFAKLVQDRRDKSSKGLLKDVYGADDIVYKVDVNDHLNYLAFDPDTLVKGPIEAQLLSIAQKKQKDYGNGKGNKNHVKKDDGVEMSDLKKKPLGPPAAPPSAVNQDSDEDSDDHNVLGIKYNQPKVIKKKIIKKVIVKKKKKNHSPTQSNAGAEGEGEMDANMSHAMEEEPTMVLLEDSIADEDKPSEEALLAEEVEEEEALDEEDKPPVLLAVADIDELELEHDLKQAQDTFESVIGGDKKLLGTKFNFNRNLVAHTSIIKEKMGHKARPHHVLFADINNISESEEEAEVGQEEVDSSDNDTENQREIDDNTKANRAHQFDAKYDSRSLSEALETATVSHVQDAEAYREKSVSEERRREVEYNNVMKQRYCRLYGNTKGTKMAADEWKLILDNRKRRNKMLASEMRSLVQQNNRRIITLQSEFIGYIITSIAVIMFVIHANITRQVALLFSCKDISSNINQTHLLADLRIKCFSGDHTTYMLSIGLPLLILWVIGLPVYALIVLFLNRRLITIDRTFLDNVERINFLRVDAKFGFLYRGFLPKRYYWFMVDLLKRCLVICVPVFVPAKIHTQFLLAACFVTAFIILQVFFRPYEHHIVDKIEFLSLFSSFFIFFLANLYFANTTKKGSRDMLEVAIIMTMIFFTICAIVSMIWLYRSEEKMRPLRELLLEVKSKGGNTQQLLKDWLDEQDGRVQNHKAELQDQLGDDFVNEYLDMLMLDEDNRLEYQRVMDGIDVEKKMFELDDFVKTQKHDILIVDIESDSESSLEDSEELARKPVYLRDDDLSFEWNEDDLAIVPQKTEETEMTQSTYASVDTKAKRAKMDETVTAEQLTLE